MGIWLVEVTKCIAVSFQLLERGRLTADFKKISGCKLEKLTIDHLTQFRIPDQSKQSCSGVETKSGKHFQTS